MIEKLHFISTTLFFLAPASHLAAQEPRPERVATRVVEHQTDDIGDFCGVLIDGHPRPLSANPMLCLVEHLRRCETAYAHSMFGSVMSQTQDAVFIRRDEAGNCRVVVMENTLASLMSEHRQLAYKTCALLVVDPTKRLWELGLDCGPERAVETCPALSSGWPCSSEAGDEAAAKCGEAEPLPISNINADEILTGSGYVLEPGYLSEWQAVQELFDNE